jgi:hypothetical protein
MQVLLYTNKGQMLHPSFKCKKAWIQISKRTKMSMWESHANRVHQPHLQQQRPESTKSSNQCTKWGIDGSWIGNTFPLRCNSLSWWLLVYFYAHINESCCGVITQASQWIVHSCYSWLLQWKLLGLPELCNPCSSMFGFKWGSTISSVHMGFA